jgi:F0F1-type ATP synthase epsilon subunit
MKTPQKPKVIKIQTDTTLKFLQVFNGILELTDTELKVLAEFIDSSETVNLCSPINKKKIAENLGIKDHNTLNNYVKRLKDKKAIVQTKNGYELSPLLRTGYTSAEVTIHILPK